LVQKKIPSFKFLIYFVELSFRISESVKNPSQWSLYERPTGLIKGDGLLYWGLGCVFVTSIVSPSHRLGDDDGDEKGSSHYDLEYCPFVILFGTIQSHFQFV
jgi:hypothetical protein